MWDLVIKNAKIFDGTAMPGVVSDIAVRDGKVVARGDDLPTESARDSHDASGQYLVPGLLDIHTHEDLEAELDPGLPEVVRHGTTSVVVGNCSIGLAFGAQRNNRQDPIVDCFARVENIPKTVLSRAADKATWDNPRDYLTHLDELPLSANIAPFLPHSMLRIEVMGLDDSVTRDPTKAELSRWWALLKKPCRMATSACLLTVCRCIFWPISRTSKSVFPRNMLHLRNKSADRRRAQVRSGLADDASHDDGTLTFKLFMLSSGRFYGKPLKVTALAALDSVINRKPKPRRCCLQTC